MAKLSGISQKCDCGREVHGLSKEHMEKLLEMHKQTSNFHQEVMKVLKEHGFSDKSIKERN